MNDEFDNRMPAESPTSQQTEILGLLWRRKWFLVLGLLVSVCLGVLDYSRREPVYQSSAQILITRSGPTLPTGGFRPELYYFQQRGTVATHAMIIASPLIAQQAVAGYAEPADDDLRKLVESIDQELGTRRDEPLEALTQSQRRLQDLPSLAGRDPVSTILSGLSVQQLAEASDVLNLSYRGSNPEDCRIIVQAIFQSYKAYLKGSRDTVTQQTYQLIDRAKNELSKELAEKELAYRKFRSLNAHLLLKGEDGQNFHFVRMSGIEAARSQLLLKRSQLSAQVKTVERALESGGGKESLQLMFERTQDTDSPLNRRRDSIATQLLPLRLQELQLTEDYGADHPDVIAVRKSIELTREVLVKAEREATGEENPSQDGTAGGAGEENTAEQNTVEEDIAVAPDKQPVARRTFVEMYLQSLRHQLAILDVEGEELDGIFQEQQSAAKDLEQIDGQEETLKDELDRKEQLYKIVVSRLEEISLTDDLGGYETDIISAPGIGAQVEPSLKRIMAVSVFLGLMGGFGLAYLVELADKTFRNAQDIQHALGLPLIGHIPVIDSRRVLAANSESKFSPMLVTVHKPLSPLAEAFRAVRTSLYFGTSGQENKILQVTSPLPGDGKSTVASNLAVTIAQSSKRVLLIDADCRRPQIHKLFGVERGLGLSSVIEEEMEPMDAVRETEIKNLSLMTAGPHTKNPAELLTSPRFGVLLESLRDKFQFVIVDSPPVLAVTDSGAVAPRVDGTILVLRITNKSRDASLRASEVLHSLNANMLGVVVNGIGRRLGYGYGSGNYGGYSAGTDYGYGFGGYEYTDSDAKKYYAEHDPDREDARAE